jgi:hypothetical protein
MDFSRKKCVRCPCEGVCLGQTQPYKVFCDWAATGDMNQLSHIRYFTERKLGLVPPAPEVAQEAHREGSSSPPKKGGCGCGAKEVREAIERAKNRTDL